MDPLAPPLALLVAQPSPLGLTDAQAIVAATGTFAVLVALLIFARLMIARIPPYKRYRVGIFVERNGDERGFDGQGGGGAGSQAPADDQEGDPRGGAPGEQA